MTQTLQDKIGAIHRLYCNGVTDFNAIDKAIQELLEEITRYGNQPLINKSCNEVRNRVIQDVIRLIGEKK